MIFNGKIMHQWWIFQLATFECRRVVQQTPALVRLPCHQLTLANLSERIRLAGSTLWVAVRCHTDAHGKCRRLADGPAMTLKCRMGWVGWVFFGWGGLNPIPSGKLT